MGTKWNGDKYEKFARESAVEGIIAAGLALHTISRKKAGVSNAGKTVPVMRLTSGGNKNTRTVYPNSSKPGESPRRRSGFGQKNIVFGFDRKKGQSRVGYTRAARYMTYHELGIRYRKKGRQKRPTIVPGLRDNLSLLSRISQASALRAMRQRTSGGKKKGR